MEETGTADCYLVVGEREHVGAGNIGPEAVENVGGVGRGHDHLRPLADQGPHARGGVEHLVTGTRETRVLWIRPAGHVSPQQMADAGESGEGSDVIARNFHFTI